MDKKYEILKDTEKYIWGRKVYRIKALKDFADVKNGDIGGYVGSEENLSQEGDCWIYGNAIALDNAVVCDNAIVKDSAVVCEHVQVSDDAMVKNSAIVYDHAKVSNNAIVKNSAVVGGRVAIKDYGVVYEYSEVRDNAVICENATVSGHAIVKDYATVCGRAMIYENAKINNHAKIKDKSQWFVAGNIGSRNDSITFYETDKVIYVNTGCFSDTLDEFIKQVKTTHNGNWFEKEYLQLVEFAKVKLEVWDEQ